MGRPKARPGAAPGLPVPLRPGCDLRNRNLNIYFFSLSTRSSCAGRASAGVQLLWPRPVADVLLDPGDEHGGIVSLGTGGEAWPGRHSHACPSLIDDTFDSSIRIKLRPPRGMSRRWPTGRSCRRRAASCGCSGARAATGKSRNICSKRCTRSKAGSRRGTDAARGALLPQAASSPGCRPARPG